jgi:hypothetical protein
VRVGRPRGAGGRSLLAQEEVTCAEAADLRNGLQSKRIANESYMRAVGLAVGKRNCGYP